MKTTNPKGLEVKRNSITFQVRETKFTAHKVIRVSGKAGVDWSISKKLKNGNAFRVSGLQTDELVSIFQDLGAVIEKIKDAREAVGVFD